MSSISWLISIGSVVVLVASVSFLYGPRSPSASLLSVSLVFVVEVPNSCVYSLVTILFALAASGIFSIFSQYFLNFSFLAFLRRQFSLLRL